MKLDFNHTMTSREIANLTGKNHHHLMRDIRNMEQAWVKIGESKFGLTYYTDQWNREKPQYVLTKTECLYIATKFNDEARASHEPASIQDRMKEALKGYPPCANSTLRVKYFDLLTLCRMLKVQNDFTALSNIPTQQGLDFGFYGAAYRCKSVALSYVWHMNRFAATAPIHSNDKKMQNDKKQGTNAHTEILRLQERYEATRFLLLAHMASQPKHDIIKAFESERKFKYDAYCFIIDCGLKEEFANWLSKGGAQ